MRIFHFPFFSLKYNSGMISGKIASNYPTFMEGFLKIFFRTFSAPKSKYKHGAWLEHVSVYEEHTHIYIHQIRIFQMQIHLKLIR